MVFPLITNPPEKLSEKSIRIMSLGLIVGSSLCIGLAPALMPAGYSPQSHYISESAAQALHGAWLARLGFLLFGFGALLTCHLHYRDWSAWVIWMIRIFGVCLIATAAFSHKPWLENVQADPFEDFLHSLTATTMGFAFCFALVGFWFVKRPLAHRVFDAVVGVLSLLLPVAGGLFPAWAGAGQRVMFAAAYVWFAWEILSRKRQKQAA
ncbi:MAG: DUF998 domain-containing protein [Acidobacteria bacterium]|nr:DUF998 domain-containing protein [Acidobacteriota bacterium]MCB9398942.1 DUF998 domain-containing protein [Acidobacteriota bacterium]